VSQIDENICQINFNGVGGRIDTFKRSEEMEKQIDYYFGELRRQLDQVVRNAEKGNEVDLIGAIQSPVLELKESV
jgi:hypothetical protein